tara:strand:- start:34 stop:276 length:243 start_codon:yes stop_codon:yes gene_type:complete
MESVSITVREESGYASTLNRAVGGFVSTVAEASEFETECEDPGVPIKEVVSTVTGSTGWKFGSDISTVKFPDESTSDVAS